LIILDVKLPDVSGFEICQRIKEDPATAAIPVLHISTTFVDIEDRIHGLVGGADGYLTDVLEPLELVAAVKALLRARKAEEAAQISTKQWQVTFDAINDGVVLLDRDGRAVQINSAREGMLGKSWNELSGQEIHDLLSIPPVPEDSPFPRMLDTGQREAVDLTLGDRWLRVTVDPIHDADGDINGGLCIASDITDRRRLEEELRRRAEELATADRRKDEFLAMLAHELRNPLAPIANALEAIRLARSNTAATEEAISIARRQIGHMARLLDDLLDVSRFTRGKVHLRKVPVDLSTILRQAVETSRPLIEKSGHELLTSFPAEPVWLDGDPTRLAQIVANLLNNAAKYTDRGGRIALVADREGDEAVVRVRDNGIGLSAEMLPRVFDLFAQADRSLDRSQGGLGIGLTLVRSLVQLHDGNVSVESCGPGQGSEFIVRLPASSRAPSTPDPNEGASSAAESAYPLLRLLVVDDSQDSARSLARVLKLWGYEVRVAHDGLEAIEAASAEAFDVILLDIGLPGINGYEVAKRLRDQFGSARPVLVALTGYGQAEDLARSQSVGFDDHLVKPVNLEKL
jgi:PAS domain S-box-containing protein